MYRKNTASQFVGFQLLLTSTGAVATGLSPTVRRCIDGTFAAGGGTVTEDSNGFYKYAMAQADTNGNDISLTFSATGAMPVCINFVTTACDPTAATNFGITNIDGTITSRMATYTQPTGFLAATFPTGTVANTTNITAGTITTVTTVTNQLTAAAIATGVWTDTTAGDFTTALSVGKSLMNGVSLGTGLTINDITTKTGYSLSGTQTFNLTGSITGSLSGSVGSVTGAVGSVTGAVGSVTGAVGSVTGAVGSVTGNVGGNVVGSVASVTGAVGSVTGAVGSVTGNVGGNVVGSVASVTARVTANTDQFNGDATAAANIAKTTKAIVRATASGVPTTTSIPTSACTPAGIVADQFKGRIITFDADTTTSALRGQATDITASSAASTPTFTVTALTTAPVSGDTFSIT